MRGHTLGAFIKLIVFAVITVFATAVLVVVIKNSTFGSTPVTYTAEFTDATGLMTGDQVKIAGVRVGTVSSVEAVDQGGHASLAKVQFTVQKNVPVYNTTNLYIRYLNLIGQRYIALQESAGDGQTQNPSTPIYKTPEGSVRTHPSLDLTALFDGFRPLFQALTPKDVNSFALDIIKTLQGEGGTIQDLVAKSATLTNTVADKDAVIGETINNLVSVLDTVEAHDTDLGQVIDQLQRLTTSLADNRGAIAASLGNIDALAGDSADLLHKIRPSLTPDIRYLGQIAQSLNTTKTCPGYFSDPGLLNNKELAAKLKKNRFANNNCKGPNTLVEFLQREPTKLAQIIRSGSYGAFFNFYACDLNIENTKTAAITFTAQACGN